MMSSSLQDIRNIGPMTADSTMADDDVKKEYEQGKRFLDQGNYGQAAAALHNALLAYEERGDKTGIANAANQLGHVCLAREDFASAEKHYSRALELCREFEDSLSLFALSKRFVEVYCGLQEYDKAIAECLQIVEIYQDNNDPRGTVAILERMAEVYLAWQRPEQAADTYRTIASIHRNFKHATIAKEFEEKAAELLAAPSE